MKKLTILIIILIICANTVSANWYNEIRETSINITNNLNTTKQKMLAIDTYVRQNNNYSFNYNPKKISKYWIDKTGDCTEIARIKNYMYKFSNINSRLVHGYIQHNNSKFKHDFVEYYHNNSWVSNEQDYYSGIVIKVGDGVW